MLSENMMFLIIIPEYLCLHTDVIYAIHICCLPSLDVNLLRRKQFLLYGLVQHVGMGIMPCLELLKQTLSYGNTKFVFNHTRVLTSKLWHQNNYARILDYKFLSNSRAPFLLVNNWTLLHVHINGVLCIKTHFLSMWRTSFLFQKDND